MTRPESKDITSVEMTSSEETRLTELEDIVAAGLDTFVAVGNALAEINTSRLYRCTHDSFESYVEDRWGMSRSRAYQLASAARVATIVDTAGLPPISSEGQARALRGLPDDEIVDIYTTATGETPQPTAAELREHRDRRLPFAHEKTRRRRPLPDAFRSQLWKAMKATESFVRVTEDDRWTTYLADLAEGPSLSDLKRMIDNLQAVHDALETGVPGPNMSVKLVVGSNTATVTAAKFAGNGIRYALRQVSSKWQTDRRTGEIKFPARHADKFVEILHATTGYRVDVERVDERP